MTPPDGLPVHRARRAHVSHSARKFRYNDAADTAHHLHGPYHGTAATRRIRLPGNAVGAVADGTTRVRRAAGEAVRPHRGRRSHQGSLVGQRALCLRDADRRPAHHRQRHGAARVASGVPCGDLGAAGTSSSCWPGCSAPPPRWTHTGCAGSYGASHCRMALFSLLYSLEMVALGNEFKLHVTQLPWTLWFLMSLICWRLLLPVVVLLRYPLAVTSVVALAAAMSTSWGWPSPPAVRSSTCRSSSSGGGSDRVPCGAGSPPAGPCRWPSPLWRRGPWSGGSGTTASRAPGRPCGTRTPRPTHWASTGPG